jgi:hypothetical protein
MAYSILKDEAKTEDRLLRSFGHEPHIETDLDTALGLIWAEVDTSEVGVASPEELGAFLEYWNQKMD